MYYECDFMFMCHVLTIVMNGCFAATKLDFTLYTPVKLCLLFSFLLLFKHLKILLLGLYAELYSLLFT